MSQCTSSVPTCRPLGIQRDLRIHPVITSGGEYPTRHERPVLGSDGEMMDENSDDDLLRRAGLPRDVCEQLPRAHAELFASQVDSPAELADDLGHILVAAGFHR